MNPRILTLAVTTALLGLLPKVVASDRWETLRAINLVENPTNQTRVGSRGELGPYQFRANTWRMHTQKPFNMATDRATSDDVAIAHYEWIKHGLVSGGVDPTAHNIAMAWNCGLSAVLGGRVPTESYRYAEQVCNLVESFKQRAQADAVAPSAVAKAAAPVPVPPKSLFQVQFDASPVQPHFVLLSEAESPLLVVSTEAPRPMGLLTNPVFAFASAD